MSTEQARAARLDELARLIAAAPHNLVAASQRQRVRTEHIAEAETIAAALPLESGQRWVDVGTGAGLPGLVLAVCRPDTTWLLVEGRRKKAAAVAGFAATLGLDNVEVAAERGEVLAREPALRGAHDGAITRAVGRLDVVAELSRGFLRPGGLAVAVKGPAWRGEEAYLRAALGRLGLAPPVATALPSPTRQTWLVTMVAIGEVPATVPRRVGVPRQQPLGDVPGDDGGRTGRAQEEEQDRGDS